MEVNVCVLNYEDKLKKLLEKFLDPHFEINNDTYLNILFTHLSEKGNEALVESPIFVEWLFKAIEQWEGTAPLLSSTVITFTTYLTSLLSKKETNFFTFNSCNIYVKLCSILKLQKPEALASTKLAYIKLLASFLEHKAGIEWLIATNNWKDVLSFCLEGPTIYIVREGYNFIYELLVKTGYNTVFHTMVIGNIMEVFNTTCTTESIIPEVNEDFLQKKLTPTLRLIAYILESCLKSELFAKRDYSVPIVFLTNFHLEQNIWNIIMIGSQNEEFLCDLNKVMILTNFFCLAIDAEDELFQYGELKKFVENIFKLIKMHIAKGAVTNIFKMCVLLQSYWKLINSRLPKISNVYDKEPLLFENQILILQIVPLFVLSFAKFCCTTVEYNEDIFREHFIMKIFKILCEHTIRMVYSFRALLTNQKNPFEQAHKAITYIMLTRQYYGRDRAVIVFQSLMYLLKDAVDMMKTKPELCEEFSKQVSYFSAHLNALATFIKEFDITWRESVETICVMSLSMDCISFTSWPSKLIVQGLKLVNLSISRFMSPNLALLVDRTSDSSMASLGAMLLSKLHDLEWEVRDSALEVLHTVSSIAHTKFPSFQRMVLNSQLPSFMVTMCMNDSESFIRVSALKCLQEMIKVPVFWKEDLRQQELLQKMIHIILNETEAIVRCEAAKLIYQIYEHQSFPEDLTEDVNHAMAYAAISDLHWEVKSNALCYWGKVINNRLTNQGMIDGTFPSVTFSKENRKIVSLTKAEIQTRLNKVLTELSTCGCLGVLVTAIQDDCDIEVSKKALKIIKSLTNLLTTYSIISSISTPLLDKSVVNCYNMDDYLPTMPYSEDVVNDIIQQRDIFLLSNIGLTNVDYSTTNGLNMNFKIVTPQEFLNFIQQDLDKIISERIKWLNKIDDLGSLLDDILKSYTDDINTMDCY